MDENDFELTERRRSEIGFSARYEHLLDIEKVQKLINEARYRGAPEKSLVSLHTDGNGVTRISFDFQESLSKDSGQLRLGEEGGQI